MENSQLSFPNLRKEIQNSTGGNVVGYNSIGQYFFDDGSFIDSRGAYWYYDKSTYSYWATDVNVRNPNSFKFDTNSFETSSETKGGRGPDSIPMEEGSEIVKMRAWSVMRGIKTISKEGICTEYQIIQYNSTRLPDTDNFLYSVKSDGTYSITELKNIPYTGHALNGKYYLNGIESIEPAPVSYNNGFYDGYDGNYSYFTASNIGATVTMGGSIITPRNTTTNTTPNMPYWENGHLFIYDYVDNQWKDDTAYFLSVTQPRISGTHVITGINTFPTPSNPLHVNFEESCRFSTFILLHQGLTWEQIVNQRPNKSNTPFGSQPGGPEPRYLQDPSHPENIIDMRHMLIIGKYGIAVGNSLELFQWVIPNNESGLNSQDYYSNQIGYEFYQWMQMRGYDINSDMFTTYLAQFFINRAGAGGNVQMRFPELKDIPYLY